MVELTWVLVQFIALGKLIYVFGVPYGDVQQEVVPAESDLDEGREA